MSTTRTQGRYDTTSPLPPGALAYLSYANPALLDLIDRYSKVAGDVNDHSQWDREGENGFESDLELAYFRGDNVYVWQLRYFDRDVEARYRLYADYVCGIDHLGLLGTLTEDGAFGCWTFDRGDGVRVSRDLLDSINQIYFLDKAWNLFGREGTNIVDIGAGYGRLAHRMAQSPAPIGQYFCVDAIPESTFICDYYLNYRGVADTAVTVPLDRLVELDRERIDLAVNIHSFSEMPLAAIDSWLDWLARHRVGHLLLTPNTADRQMSWEKNEDLLDAAPVLRRHGFRRVAAEPIIADPEIRAATGIETYFLFYELGI